MAERETTEAEMLDAGAWDGGYEARCKGCAWKSGVFLLGPVALRHALEHTEATHHDVAVFQGVE